MCSFQFLVCLCVCLEWTLIIGRWIDCLVFVPTLKRNCVSRSVPCNYIVQLPWVAATANRLNARFRRTFCKSSMKNLQQSLIIQCMNRPWKMGPHISPNFKILGTRMVTRSRICSAASQTLQNLVVRATLRPGFVHCCHKIRKSSMGVEIPTWQCLRASTREIYETDIWSDTEILKKYEGVCLQSLEYNIMNEIEVYQSQWKQYLSRVSPYIFLRQTLFFMYTKNDVF